MTGFGFCSMEGRIAIVTGGARGIGKAIVEKLAGLGANVVIADMLLDLAAQSATEISRTTGKKIIATQVDVTDGKSTNQLIEHTQQEFGKVDILVNNAGITRDTLILRMATSSMCILYHTPNSQSPQSRIYELIRLVQ